MLNKQQFKNLISECTHEIIEEKINSDILKEAFELDMYLLENYREQHRSILSEGVSTETEIDEGFFDTISSFAKNSISNVKDAWKRAKDEGDKSEMDRLQKQLDALKKKMGIQTPTSSSTPTLTPPITTSSSAVSPTIKPPANKSTKVDKVIVKKVIDNVLNKVKTGDVVQYKALVDLTNSKTIGYLFKNPAVIKRGNVIKNELANKPGKTFSQKVDSWIRSNKLDTLSVYGLLRIMGEASGNSDKEIMSILKSSLASAGKKIISTPTPVPNVKPVVKKKIVSKPKKKTVKKP